MLAGILGFKRKHIFKELKKHLPKTPQQTKEETNSALKIELPEFHLKSIYLVLQEKKYLKLRSQSRSLAHITICQDKKWSWEDQLQLVGRRRGALNGRYSLVTPILKSDGTCFLSGVLGLRQFYYSNLKKSVIYKHSIRKSLCTALILKQQYICGDQFSTSSLHN